MLPYIQALLDAHRAGRASEHIHLGWWPDPTHVDKPIAPEHWALAQARLSEQIIGHADLKDGHDIADIGCGIGGTLLAIAQTGISAQLTGVNIDRRQIEYGRVICPSATWIEASATKLPFPNRQFDRVICLEAAFHFPDRHQFLSEVARILRPDGLLIHADLLIDATLVPDPLKDAVAKQLDADLGPWPHPWVNDAGVRGNMHDVGLEVVFTEDLTASTSPSYSFVAPGAARRLGPPLSRGPGLLRDLHHAGALSYPLYVAQLRGQRSE